MEKKNKINIYNKILYKFIKIYIKKNKYNKYIII